MIFEIPMNLDGTQYALLLRKILVELIYTIFIENKPVVFTKIKQFSHKVYTWRN